MALKNINPTTSLTWQNLQTHFEKMREVKMQDLFAHDSERAQRFQLKWNDFLLDFSKNRITQETIDLLLNLAESVELKDAIARYFEGDYINKTEKRAVLHTALRAKADANIVVDGVNVMPEVVATREAMARFTNEILNGNRKGFSGKVFTDIVNVGIGGSDLGSAMVAEALQFYKTPLNSHFVSNIDGDHIQEVLKNLNPETTLFVIVSKTFVSQETLANAQTIKKWFLESATQNDVYYHFVAVSANEEKAIEFGISKENIFPMWDWVGGRFSLWSAVGLPISLAIGSENFDQLLKGAQDMDEHFRNNEFNQNIPVILALLDVWYNNFFECESQAVIPYCEYLRKFVPYLQQAIMESNGKSTDRDGNPVNYQTGNVIWGEPGTNCQHAFFQLIHQGTKLIPTDFIGFIESLYGNEEHHNILMANFFAQSEAFLNGKTKNQVISEIEMNGKNIDEHCQFLLPFKEFEGNKPSNTILIQKLTPETLGSLIAMYEHKIFVQGVIWNIFSYDQWGVELGKQLASSILSEINSEKVGEHDASTISLLKYFIEKKSVNVQER